MSVVRKIATVLAILTLFWAQSARADRDQLADSIRDTLLLARSLRTSGGDNSDAIVKSKVLVSVTPTVTAEPVRDGSERPDAIVKRAALVSTAPAVTAEPVRGGCPSFLEDKKYARYDHIINRTASRYGFKDSFIRAVIHVESDFNQRAVSHAGAMGLMQLMPRTADEMRVEDPFDPTQNIEGGTAYLRYLMERYGDARRALLAYYGGPRLVDRGIVPKNGIEYLKRVFSYYRYYENGCIILRGSSLAGTTLSAMQAAQ